MNDLPKFNALDTECFLSLRRYSDGTPAITVIEAEPEDIDDDLFAVLTVAIEGAAAQLQEDEILVKLWSENGCLSHFVEADCFEDTGKRIEAGFAEAQVWKILDYSAFQQLDEQP
jgi:hypothetical protein